MARKLTLALVLGLCSFVAKAQLTVPNTYQTTSVGSPAAAPDTIFSRQNGTGVPLRVRIVIKGSTGVTTSQTWGPTINIVNQPAVDADGVAGGPTVNVPATPNVPVRWELDGLVFVTGNSTLTIQPGTVVWAQPGTDTDASALIVSVGSRLVADGTSSNPIIFTYLGDNVAVNNETSDRTAGQWGGVVICGDAPTNLGGSGQRVVEGILQTDTRGNYGGTAATGDADHDGGIVRYVSIRNTGTALVGTTGNELQGLTLAGCGSGTIIDYVESIFSKDDGIEVFGGTVSIKHFLVAFTEDDMFDFDQGWAGDGQYWFGYQYAATGEGRGMELDGDDSNVSGNPSQSADGQPYATGRISNATIIAGKGVVDPEGAILRANASYDIINSIFCSANVGIRLNASNEGTTIPTELGHITAGRLSLRSNLFCDIGATPATTVLTGTASTGNVFRYSSSTTTTLQATLTADLTSGNNVYRAAADLTYVTSGERDAVVTGTVNPIPGSTAGYPTPFDPNVALPVAPKTLATVNYIGAFNPASETVSSNWASWTYFANVYMVGAPTPNERPQAPLFFESYTFGPNPTSGTIFVRMQVKQSVDAQFDLINVNGQVLRTKSQYLTANGETHVVEVDANGLGNGVYFLRSRNRATGDLLRTDRVVKQ